MSPSSRVPPLVVRLQVLTSIDYAKGNTIRDRIKAVSQQTFANQTTGQQYKFTWRTIETWLCLMWLNEFVHLEVSIMLNQQRCEQ
jgi:hypothetical protein